MLQSHASDDKFQRYLASKADESFCAALHEFLADDISKIIRTDGSWSVGSIIHQDVAKTMVDKIIWWLFDDDPEQSLLRLEQLNNPQHICGRVFKSGEPTYSCRDCAMDPTCVFCQQCFWKSEHQKHRYKADMDDGGGMCDCGDSEAFNNYFRCSDHEEQFVKSLEKTTEDAVSRLPVKVRQRAPYFFDALLSYIVEFLTNEKTSISDMDSSLQPREKLDSFVTMLFNDELHTFDFVIDILKKALKCDDALGADFATIVDREGRSAVCIDTEVKCEEVKKIVGTPPTPFFSFRTDKPLKTLVIHTNIVAHQEMALLLLSMLSKIVQQSEGLRKIFCNIALNESVIAIPPEVSTSSSGKMSPVERLMRCDHILWKTPRNQYLQLLMNSLLLDAETKKSFAVLFTRLYLVMQDGFIKGDHDHSQSVTSLAVQLYTVPTVARHLIVSEDVIGMILRALAKSCYDSSHLDRRDWCKVFKIDTKQMKSLMRRGHYSFYDLRYILAILPDQWSSDLKNKFIEGTKMFLQILMAMQGMDGVVRRTDHHIEREPDWETGTTIAMRFQPIIHHMLQWISSEVDLLFIVLNLCFQASKALNEVSTGSMKLGTTTYANKPYPCVDYDITKQPVSTQYPVSRFTAAILVELAKRGVSWSDIEKNKHVAEFFKDSSIAIRLMECPLRCLCLSSQVNCGMWRRNGLSLVNQLMYYKEYRYRQEAFERDIQMIQVCAGKMDPNQFISVLLHKMKLNPQSDDLFEYRVSLMNEFFRLLISVCGERFLPGIGDVTIQQLIRRQIVQILAVESKPHSKIVKQLPESITDKIAWEDILLEVADFHEPASINATGRYVLKPSSISEFSPYSYHYTSPTEETKAQQEIARRKKALRWSTVVVPPKLPRFAKLLSNVSNILCCDVFVRVMSNFLQQLTTENKEQWSDKLVDKALYLIGMAIVENEQQLERDPLTEFDFGRKAITGCESGILFLLKQLQVMEPFAIHRETIRWLVTKIERLTNQRGGASSSVDPENMTQTNEPIREQDSARSARKRKAQELRDKLLSQMKIMQQNFLSQNPELVSDHSNESSMELSQESAFSQEISSPVCTDVSWQFQALRNPEPAYTCILCQEESSPSNGSIVMSAYVQRSTVLTRGARDELSIEQCAPLFIDISFPNGIHTSTCSHTMHYSCFKQFRASVNSTEARRRHPRYSRRSFDTAANEFLCPLCSRLSNTVLPAIPQVIVATQRGITLESDPMEGTSVDQPIVTPSWDEATPSLKLWLKAIEEMLRPMKQPAQEVVIKFQAEVSSLDEEMEKAELAGDETGNSGNLEETVRKLAKVHAVPTSDVTTDSSVLHEELQEALNDYLQTVQTFGLNGNVSDLHRPMTSWLCVATTFTCAEMVSRLNGTHVLSKTPVRTSAALDGVVRAAFGLAATCSEECLSDIRKYSQQLISALVGDDTDEHFAILNCSMFSVFVNLWFSSAALRRSKQIQENQILRNDLEFEKNILHLCILAQIVQIFLNINEEKLSTTDVTTEKLSSQDSQAIFHAFKQIRSIAELPDISPDVTEKQVLCFVRENLCPFLRSCALFLHHVTGVPGPESEQYQSEFRVLQKYLGLPKYLSELIDVRGKLSLEPLIQKWVTHPSVMARVRRLPRHLSYPFVSEVPNIIPFPEDYSDLIGSAASFRCPKFASEDSLYPTMCLVCGLMLCSQSYCCQQALPEKNHQVGACTFHAKKCGAGSGMFLRVREATIVLLNGIYRGCFVPAPYLDKHGEADKGLRRGNPLYLNQPRLLEIRKLWLSHGIAEKVSHDIEARNIGGMLDWAHL